MNKKTLSYIGLVFVVFVWGCCPLVTVFLNKVYSPTFRVCVSEFILLFAYLVLSGKAIREFGWRYIKVGLPSGFFLALANITQKIGILHTTPARYAFLENLSCISVPILLFIFIKKRPTLPTVAASVVCLASAFVLNGVSFSGTSWGIGEILCALAGIFYGFNIAITGTYAKKLNVPLYLATQSMTGFTVGLVTSLVLNSPIGNNPPIEKIVFSFDPVNLLFVALYALIGSALCWIIRTAAMREVDASVVAIISPFSAVITSVLSVLLGTDGFSSNLVFGGLLGLLAIFLSSYEDIFKKN